MGDARSMGNGWGHQASAIPTAIGDYLFVPVMSGNVYVLRHDSETLDENSLVSINDLGPIGQSWTRASISYSKGKLYAHTIGKLICIGERCRPAWTKHAAPAPSADHGSRQRTLADRNAET